MSMGFWPTWDAIKPLQRGEFPQRKYILKEICTEIILNDFIQTLQINIIMQITMKLEAT